MLSCSSRADSLIKASVAFVVFDVVRQKSAHDVNISGWLK